ncbi:MAG: hypothetical protein AAFX53_06645 [Bacteroidota bacterium]
MKSTIDYNYKLEKIGAIVGIVSIIFYFSAAILPFIPQVISRLLGFTFPLLWIIAFMGLHSYLKRNAHTPSLEIAYLFGIIGASLACTFIVVQQANFIWHDIAKETANSQEALSLLKATFRGANRVQGGMDVAFDIFITISWFLFGLNIIKHASFGKVIGLVTCLLSISLLTLNMITFPTPPAEAGLFDLGPFLGLWILVVYTRLALILFKKNNRTP